MRTMPLGEIAELRAGVGFPPRLQGRSSGDYPMAKVGDISRVGRSGHGVLHSADNYVCDEDLPDLKMNPVPEGSVLFAKIGEAIRKNHRVVAGRPLLIDNNAMAAIPQTSFVDPRFLFRFLQAFDFYSLASSTTVPSLRKSELARVQVPLPHLEEQRCIAATLDHADALRVKRRQGLAHLDDLTQSIFHDMIPASVARGVPVREVVTSIDSGTSPKCEARPASSDEWGVLKLGAVTYGIFNEAENKAFLRDVGSMAKNEVQAGDVLMTRKNTRELVGAVALVEEGVRGGLLLPDLIFRLRLDVDRVHPRFFHGLMSTRRMRDAVRNLSSGSAASMPNISKARLRDLSLDLPDMAVQTEFARRVAFVDALRHRVLRARAVEDELFASLQSRAFQGEL